MKLSAIALLVVAFLASIAFSVPTSYDSYKHCKDFIVFSKPMDGDVFKINSTQIIEFDINKSCYDEYGM